MSISPDQVIRSLDPATESMTPAERQRADATLERILSSPRLDADLGADVTASRRRRTRRLVLLPSAAAVLVFGTLVIPGMGGPGTAYASWSATPTAVAARDLDAVKAACQEKVYGDDNARSVKLALSERRGEVVGLLYHSDNPDVSAFCIARNPSGTTDVSDVQVGFGGSSGPAPRPPARAFTQGAIGQFEGDPPPSMTDGAVGDDVIGVTIHAYELTTTATVKGGRYAAWWPGPAFEDGREPDNGEAGPQPILTYDLTLKDGTTIRDATPNRPA